MSMEPLTQERRRQLTREHLLAAAAQVFAERGFYGATLDEVARVAGFTKGAVYSNFDSKDDLFLALFKANYEREMAQLVATLESSVVPAVDRLSDFVALIQEEMSTPRTRPCCTWSSGCTPRVVPRHVHNSQPSMTRPSSR